MGKEGVMTPLLKRFLDMALESELDHHLDEEERQYGNRKNGHTRKTVKSPSGEFEISTPRDRKGSFEPKLVKKRETILADSLQDKIIGLYALGNSISDIQTSIKEIYDTEISAGMISEITDRVLPELEDWKARPLDQVYCIVWLDAMYYKVRSSEGRVVTRCVYNVLGINCEGRKELLGMYLSESEGANFWLQVLNDLQARGVDDILIACIDNLKGFAEAIESIFPATEVQLCVVHQIRNSLRYVASKDQKEFMRDLKKVYRAPNKQAAESYLEQLSEKWGERYPVVIKSWKTNWERLTAYFAYSPAIRKLIYTTNAVEGFHRQVRKVTKNKGAFVNDKALEKLIYLAVRNIQKKWTQPLQNWSLTIQQLAIRFEGRVNLGLL